MRDFARGAPPGALALAGGCERPSHGEDGYAHMMRRHLGPELMEVLADPETREVAWNPGDGVLRVDRGVGGRVALDIVLDARRVEMFLNTAGAREGIALGRGTPSVQASLPQAVFHGARLQGLVPPITTGPAFVIRKPAMRVYSLPDWRAANAVSQEIAEELAGIAGRRESVLIIGATASGKTTLANTMLLEIAGAYPADRIVVLEDTPEIRCMSADQLTLRTADGWDLAQLVKWTLRLSPDRIVIGEVRDGAALYLMDAWATGHPGGVATLHAADPVSALHRLDRLAQREGVPPQAELVAEACEWIVTMRRRTIVGLARVRGLDASGRYVVEGVHEWREMACV
jgi:P-type conjugative transfer ATPase TrbB